MELLKVTSVGVVVEFEPADCIQLAQACEASNARNLATTFQALAVAGLLPAHLTPSNSRCVDSLLQEFGMRTLIDLPFGPVATT